MLQKSLSFPQVLKAKLTVAGQLLQVSLLDKIYPARDAKTGLLPEQQGRFSTVGRVACLVGTFMLLQVQATYAQGAVSNSLTQITETAVLIFNILFGLFLAFAVIKTVSKWFTDAPDKVGSLTSTIIGIMIFGGFQFIKDDLASFLGGALEYQV